MSKRNRDYEKEIKDTANRMRKYPEHLKSARSSKTWTDFLLNVVDINPNTIESKQGKDFWNKVREDIAPRQAERRSIYQEARQAGMPAKIARRIRDWSPERAEREIINWQSRY